MLNIRLNQMRFIPIVHTMVAQCRYRALELHTRMELILIFMDYSKPVRSQATWEPLAGDVISAITPNM